MCVCVCLSLSLSLSDIIAMLSVFSVSEKHRISGHVKAAFLGGRGSLNAN